jgi:hypothetical protein
MVVVSSIFYIPKALKIKSINCSSQYGPFNPYYSGDLQEIVGMSVKEGKDSAEKILNDSVLVQKHIVHYQITGKLDINVVEAKPYYAIKSENLGTTYLVDDKGYILSETTSTSLPYLVVSEIELAQGELVKDELLFSLKLLYDMNTLFQTAYGEYTNEGVIVRLPNGHKVIFPTEGDVKVLVGGARLIYQQLNSQAQETRIDIGDEALTIDMRFKNPVIRK